MWHPQVNNVAMYHMDDTWQLHGYHVAGVAGVIVRKFSNFDICPHKVQSRSGLTLYYLFRNMKEENSNWETG